MPSRNASPKYPLCRFDRVLDQAAVFFRRDSDTRSVRKRLSWIAARRFRSEPELAPESCLWWQWLGLSSWDQFRLHNGHGHCESAGNVVGRNVLPHVRCRLEGLLTNLVHADCVPAVSAGHHRAACIRSGSGVRASMLRSIASRSTSEFDSVETPTRRSRLGSDTI